MEYALPASDIPFSDRQSLHPWIAEFIGTNPDQARQKLADRWATISRPSLAALRETLLQFDLRSIVIHEGQGYLRAVRPNSDEDVIGNDWYLPSPVKEDQIQQELEESLLGANTALSSFFLHFGGLAESLTESGGFVSSVQAAERYIDFLEGQNEAISDFFEWKDSLIIYHDLSGNLVLVHASGKIGWHILAEHMSVFEADSFDSFIETFSNQRRYPYPFTAYGIPDETE